MQANTAYFVDVELSSTNNTGKLWDRGFAPSREFNAPAGPTNFTIDSNGVWTRGVGNTGGFVRATVTTGNPNTADLTIDFGFHLKIVIGDQLWYDSNFNGLQDTTNETPGGTFQSCTGCGSGVGQCSCVVLELVNASDPSQSVSTVATSAGNFLFERRDFPTFLRPSTLYFIRVAVPQTNNAFDQLLNYQPTLQDVGSDDTRDSDHALTVTRTRSVTANFTSPAAGSADLTRDFGWVPLFRVGDYVWRDTNVIGTQDEAVATAGLNGVQVELYRGSTLLGGIVTVNTPNAGFYEFNSRDFDMVPGQTYSVSIQVCTPTNSSRNGAALCPPGSLVPLVPTAFNTSADATVSCFFLL